LKRVLIKISYDGTNYHGWQVQPNGITIQETLQNAIESVLGTRIPITGCSRTDAGVHAKEFYCHLDCEDSIPESAFIRGLNSCLPNDIAVLEYKEVPNDFHARYNVLGKNYVYNFYYGITNPFLDRYSLRLEKTLDVEKIKYFCNTIIGEHDFCGFSSSGRTVEDTVRNVTECDIYRENNLLKFSITANGFLYNMVRIIAGTAVGISNGSIDKDIANEIFISKDRSLGGNTLSPKGLFLNKVFY